MRFSFPQFNRKRIFKWTLISALVFSLLLALFIGAFNSHLSSQQVKEQMKVELGEALPGWDVDFKNIGLTFSGVLPRFSLVISDPIFSGEKSCYQWKVEGDEVRVDLLWQSLLRGLVQIGRVSVGSIDAALDVVKNCSSGQRVPQSASSESKKTEETEGSTNEAVVESSQERTLKKLERVSLFRELQIERIHLSHQDQKIIITNLSSSEYFPDRPFDVEGRIQFEAEGKPHLRYPKVRFQSSLSPNEIKWSSKGKWREGSLSFDGTLKDGTLQLDGSLKHIPLSPAVHLLSYYGLWEKSLEYQSAWLSCELSINGELKNVNLDAKLTDCQVKGEIGDLSSEKINLRIQGQGQAYLLEPIELELSKVHLEKILNVLDIDVLRGVLKEFGLISADVLIQPGENVELIGEVENVVLGFSNDGVAGRQRVPKVKGKVFFDGKRVSGQLLDLELQNGEFEGGLSFNFNRHFSEGTTQINISRILFDPTIQKLLIDGDISPIAAFGKATVEENKITRWDGEVGLDKLKNDSFLLNRIRVIFGYHSGVLNLNVKSKDGELSKESELFSLLKPVFLTRTFDGESVPWKKLSARFLVSERTSLSWKKASALFDQERIRLGSEGGWSVEGDLFGWLSVNLPGFKSIRWDLSGKKDKPLIAPNHRSLKELAKQPKEK